MGEMSGTQSHLSTSDNAVREPWTPKQITRRQFSLRARLLGVKIMKVDDHSATIGIPKWGGETVAEAVRKDLEDHAQATGQSVTFTRYGRFIRVEASG